MAEVFCPKPASDYYFNYKNVGEADVTFTDKYGQSATCHVFVKPDPLIVSYTSITLDRYSDYDDYDSRISVENEDGDNHIVAVKSSNTQIVKENMLLLSLTSFYCFFEVSDDIIARGAYTYERNKK